MRCPLSAQVGPWKHDILPGEFALMEAIGSGDYDAILSEQNRTGYPDCGQSATKTFNLEANGGEVNITHRLYIN
jgi:hypothetical protein